MTEPDRLTDAQQALLDKVRPHVDLYTFDQVVKIMNEHYWGGMGMGILIGFFTGSIIMRIMMLI